ncbi:polynucleotide adenylyltransferase PcnB [Pseudohaliea rubra]|uniref:Poly(A) polymerase I n=1 Tax=Pseudohaliea rubra DSM 19751 TaxID=1265313 RepID=A0A095WVN7_9GAMM|nr:polynucleotide adenylyltransferase PcnB [Pseudohaliea rubra]KGE02709.1 Poly(A) polymerase [Pseudohaliea rubra DSM 19751]
MKVIPRDQHCISRKNISPSALKVMARLRGQDFQAYLVGGAVRDLLLGGHPKDFDVATDATPEEVHGLFRNSRIIGRRFRIVHVRFGREIIEVTTFRGHHDGEGEGRRGESGVLLRDNVYGTLEEDAVRRDLSINALYYNAGDFAVHDYADGLADLQARLIRIIGDPHERYREDPVRMLRVVRFAAKLGFRIEHHTAAAIKESAGLLDAIPAPRLFDEILKLFLAGYGAATLTLLRRHHLLEHLFPEAEEHMKRDVRAADLLAAAMASTDQRVAEDRPVTPAFILAALLWPAASLRAEQLRDRGEPPTQAMHSAAQQVIAEACHRIAIPKRFSQPMREIWELQHRLESPRGKRAAELPDQRRFRAAYDFLLLREIAGEDTGGVGEWWTRFQELDLEARSRELAARDPGDGKRGRRSGRRRRSPD